MQHIWKFLSIISGFVLAVFAIPMICITWIHTWLCRKANPEFNTLTSILDSLKSNNNKKPEYMGKDISEIMRVVNPELIDSVNQSANEIVRKNKSAWETAEYKSVGIVNPIIPRISTVTTKE